MAKVIVYYNSLLFNNNNKKMFPLSLPEEQVQSEVFTHVEGSPHVTQSDHARPGDFPS